MRTSLRECGRRDGLASVAVLVCLVVLTLIAGVILRQGAARREQGRAQARRLQAEYLAEAGVRRARARIAADPGYRGETWTIPGASLGRTGSPPSSEHDAVVEISLEAAKDDPKVREIRVRADYPRDPQLRARQTRRAAVEVESKPTNNGGAKE